MHRIAVGHFAGIMMGFIVATFAGALLQSYALLAVAVVLALLGLVTITFPAEYLWYITYGFNHTICWDCYINAIAGRGKISPEDIESCKSARARQEEAAVCGHDLGHRPNRREW